MAILTHICPHCGTDRVGLRIVAATVIPREGWVAHTECPKCNLPVGARMSALQGRQQHDWSSYSRHPGDIEGLGWTATQIWPDPPRPLIPELLPPDVERIYLQAERNFPIAGNEEASGSMYGKALDIGLKKIDPSLSGMLGKKIKTLADAGKLTSDIAEWSGHIRDIRNDAVHEEDPVTRDELIALRNFTEMVLRYLFSLPNAVKKRRGEKLDWEP